MYVWTSEGVEAFPPMEEWSKAFMEAVWSAVARKNEFIFCLAAALLGERRYLGSGNRFPRMPG